MSLYDIKAGADPDDKRADELASALLDAVALEGRREAERLYRASEQRASILPPEALRFIATAEYVAEQLNADPHLEWSPAVIGICKAMELSIATRILIPLAAQTTGQDLKADRADADIGRVATFCEDRTRKVPELGVFGHFLQTVIHSRQRRDVSTLIGSFLRLVSNWVGSNWLLDPQGLHLALTELLSRYRNRAAHIDELGGDDYNKCRELVIGTEGALWKLMVATDRHK